MNKRDMIYVAASFVLYLFGPPALVIAAAVVIRTRLEDSMLREGLDGYAEYAGRVRFRLLPGVR